MKKLIIISAILFKTFSVYAQSNSIQLELAGHAPFIALGVEHQFKKKNSRTAYIRAGVGYAKFYETPDFTIPLETGHILGSKKSHVELGMAVTFVSSDFLNDNSIIQKEENVTSFIFAPRVGYRYQKSGGWFIYM